MEKYVLDTNLFFNMEAGFDMGQKTEEVIKNMTQIMQSLKGTAEFYMPPRVVDELLSFFEDKEQPFLKEFLSVVIVKSPDINKMSLPAEVFYKLIEDIRFRSYRGLTVGDEEIQKAGQMMAGQPEMSKKDFQIKIGGVVKTFRDRYRQATRFGFLDSVADLDLIMLAKELDGFLISTDEGVIKWGRSFGVKEMMPDVFGAKMRNR